MNKKIPVSLAEDLNDIVAEGANVIEKHIVDHHKRATKFIVENPLLSMLGAVAVGFVVGRLLTKERVVYMERES